MKFALKCLLAAASGVVASAETYQTPPPTLNPKPYTEWVGAFADSRLAHINVPFINQDDGSDDSVHLYRVDLVGDTYSRGFAYGNLMYKEIIYFAEIGLNKYLIDAIMGLDISNAPDGLRQILHLIQIKAAEAAPALLNQALTWVYDTQIDFTPSYLIEEMEAIGDGICNAIGGSCDVKKMQDMVKRTNMFPELIRMACTAFGAWGPASESGNLVQLRALDLGGGPFGNYTVLHVFRDSEGETPAFMSLAYPGMVGVITGVAESGIGISEKVWYISGEPSPKGSYNGEADVFVLRDILQFSATKEDALAHMQSVTRTWGIWAGVGDFASQELDLVGYQMASAIPYDDVTMPSMTNQPYMESLAYVDKHAQPSDDPSLPQVLSDHYGNISLATVPVITQYHRTGDAQIAVYDFEGTGNLIFAIGRTNADGQYGPEGGDLSAWCAYNRPYLLYSMEDLWNGI